MWAMATKRSYRNGLSAEINHCRLEPEIKAYATLLGS